MGSARFAKKKQRPSFRLEQDRIPRRKALAVRLHAITTSTGADQLPAENRESQMLTSAFPSACPPNQAATSPLSVSAIVEAWQERNGACSKMNSDFTTPAGKAVGGIRAGCGGVPQDPSMSNSKQKPRRVVDMPARLRN